MRILATVFRAVVVGIFEIGEAEDGVFDMVGETLADASQQDGFADADVDEDV